MEGGTISGNKSEGEGYGGGVLILGKRWSGEDSFSTFSKTGGVIYGNDDDEDKKNIASDDNKGHAIYAAAYALSTNEPRVKDSMVGVEDSLNYTVSKDDDNNIIVTADGWGNEGSGSEEEIPGPPQEEEST
jgi:hypothetical protein